jgi:hypothetical protein
MKNKGSFSFSPAIFGLAASLSLFSIVLSFVVEYLKDGTMGLSLVMTFILACAWALFFLFDSGTHRVVAAKFGCYTKCRITEATIRTRKGKSEVMLYAPELGIYGFFHRRSDRITIVSKELVSMDIPIFNLLYKDNRKDTIRINLQFSPNSDDQSILALKKSLEEYSSVKEYIHANPRFDIMKEEIGAVLRKYFSEITFETIDKQAIGEMVMNKVAIPNMQIRSFTITKV